MASWVQRAEGSWVPGWGISWARSRDMGSLECWEVLVVEPSLGTSSSRLRALTLLAFFASCPAPCQMRRHCGGSSLFDIAVE